ncbi:TrbI/VirB10 family protein [Alcaligenes phenolicus]
MSQDDAPDLATPQAGKVAPEAVALRAQPRPVTRLNRRTLAILAGGLSVAVFGATIWSLQPQRRGASEQAELYNVDRVSKSEGLDALPTDYSKLPALPPAAPELGPPLPGDLGPAIVNSQQPVTPAYTPPGHDPEDALRKEADAAAASSVFFRSGGQGQAAATVAQAAPGVPGAASALAAFDPLAAGPASVAAQPADPTAVQNRQDQKEAFLKGGSTETRNSGNLALPASPYQVMASTVIAGALVTGIKSDLPGDVIATVTEPVYDTATGKFLLIPQGSRILGRYNSQVSYGQSRVQVVWNRIILPDTSSLTLDNLVGTDPGRVARPGHGRGGALGGRGGRGVVGPRRGGGGAGGAHPLIVATGRAATTIPGYGADNKSARCGPPATRPMHLGGLPVEGRVRTFGTAFLQ